MQIEELQQVCGKRNLMDPYNSQKRRFNLAVLLGTLLVAGQESLCWLYSE
jgi:hypothetical protein